MWTRKSRSRTILKWHGEELCSDGEGETGKGVDLCKMKRE